MPHFSRERTEEERAGKAGLHPTSGKTQTLDLLGRFHIQKKRIFCRVILGWAFGVAVRIVVGIPHPYQSA